jgi:hypothetical protein
MDNPLLSIDIRTCEACGGAVEVIRKALTTLAGQFLASIKISEVEKEKCLRTNGISFD